MSARAALLALLLGGCESGESALDPNVDAAKACHDFAYELCNFRSSCTGGESVRSEFGDVATCIARETLACTTPTGATDSGRSPVGVEACTQAYSGYSCADWFDAISPTACSFRGTRATGAACAFAAQCQSGYCTDITHAQCGTCGTPPPAGSSCRDTGCGRRQSCNARTATCVVLGAAGAACNGDTQPCGYDLSCGSDSTSTCVAATAMEGDSCKDHCANTQGITCQGPEGSTSCEKTPFATDGQPCGETSTGYVSCAAGRCYVNGSVAFNGVIGTCRAFAADGATCDLDAGPGCMTPARCIPGDGGSTGVCTLPSADACD